MSQQPSKIINIHIGLPKTGTTTLQIFFFRNRKSLLSANLIYPEAGLLNYGHHKIAKLFHETPAAAPWIPLEDQTTLLQNFEHEIGEKNGDILLSSEAFSICSPSRLASSLRTGMIRPIAFIREQSNVVDSWIRQNLRSPNSNHNIEWLLSEFLKRHNYERKFLPWRSAFGKDLTVIPLEMASATGRPLSEIFFDAIGKKMPENEGVYEKSNQKLSRAVLDFSYKANVREMEHTKRSKVWKHLEDYCKLFKDPPKYQSIISPKQVREVYEYFRSGNKHFAETYLDQEAREFFLRAGPKCCFDWEPWPGLCDTQFADIKDFLRGRKIDI